MSPLMDKAEVVLVFFRLRYTQVCTNFGQRMALQMQIIATKSSGMKKRKSRGRLGKAYRLAQ
jgi:peroxiredoxin